MKPDFKDSATRHLALALNKPGRTIVVASAFGNGLHCETYRHSERPRELILVARSLIQETYTMLDRCIAKMDADEKVLLLDELQNLDREMVVFRVKHGITATEEK